MEWGWVLEVLLVFLQAARVIIANKDKGTRRKLLLIK
jgi:hypothetical protein